jgi:AraC-like DNA-binding protein
VECFRGITYIGKEEITIRICPNGFPGIAFHHHKGKSIVESIETKSGRNTDISTLFLYGQVTELSIMRFTTPFVTMQTILKPHALRSLFDINASALTNQSIAAGKFGGKSLNRQLIEAKDDDERIALLSDFLAIKSEHAVFRDMQIESSLLLIDEAISTISVEELHQHAELSERQFERIFKQAAGISPHLYIRIRRINEALKLMDSSRYDRLVDVAHTLNFHDQSHFIRDIKEFSGLTPKGIQQRVEDFYHDNVGSSYLHF